MKKLVLSLVSFLALSVFAQNSNVINDPNAVNREVDKGFSAIRVSSGIDLYLTQSDEESVAVSASEEKYLDGLKTVVQNGTLKIYYESKGGNWTTGNKKKLKAYVSIKTLSKIDASAGSEVMVNGIIESDDLDLDFSSGAIFNGKIDTKSLFVDLSSGSAVNITGNTQKLDIGASSGANFKGYEFETEFCEAKASSGASVQITVQKELNAKASGGGLIRYKGGAVIKDIKISGGGAIKKA